MKVVPVIRTTTEGPLSTSKLWAAALEKGQGFLYVARVDERPGQKRIVHLSLDAKGGVTEKFNPLDIRAHPWKGWECRRNPGATLRGKGAKKAKAGGAKKAKAKAGGTKKVSKPSRGPALDPETLFPTVS